jgi:hypothetical protein
MRKYLPWLGFWVLLLVQLLCIGWYLTMLFPAKAEAPSVGSTQLSPAKLGTFLEQYPLKKPPRMLLSDVALFHMEERAFVGRRGFKDKNADATVNLARKSFEAECLSLGGHLDKRSNAAEIANYYKVPFKAEDLSLCVSADEAALGALIASSYHSDYYSESYVALFVMTEETAAEMMAIYHQAVAQDQRLREAIAKDDAAKRDRIEAWRQTLTIGTETHCGPVIEVRGPMVQVAYRTQPGWVRIERLYPPDDPSTCWDFGRQLRSPEQ